MNKELELAAEKYADSKERRGCGAWYAYKSAYIDLKSEQKQVVSDEEIEKLAENEYPLHPTYRDFDNLNKSYRITFVRGFKSALQYTKPSAGVWVKASERKPKQTVETTLFIRYNFNGIVWEKEIGDAGLVNELIENGWEDVEWLDESALQYSAGGFSEFADLMRQFEKRNNISIAFHLCSDGSCHFEEFWKDEILKECETINEAVEFLKNTDYELDENGLCFSPVRPINK